MRRIQIALALGAGAMLVVFPALVADRFCIAGLTPSAARLRFAELRSAGNELEEKLTSLKRLFVRTFPCGDDWVYAQRAIEEGQKKLATLHDCRAPVSEIAAVENDIKEAEELLQSLHEDMLRRTDNGRITV